VKAPASGHVALQVSWCASDAELAETQRRSHDTLVELMGERRRGGVRWQMFTGLQALKAISNLEQQTRDPVVFESYEQVRQLLSEYGGIMVVASASASASAALPAARAKGKGHGADR
jgi:hypothetical protein